MSQQQLLLMWNGADDNHPHLTCRFAPQYDSNGDFPNLNKAMQVPLDNINYTRPVAIWNEPKGNVLVCLTAWAKHDKTAVMLASLHGQGQIGTYSLVVNADQSNYLTGVVLADKEPFYSYTADWAPATTIACHATNFDTTGDWSWTSNGMVETAQGPSLILVNNQLVYNLTIKKKGDDTIYLYAEDPDTIKKAIYQAQIPRTYKWEKYSVQFSGRKFCGAPVVAISSSANSQGDTESRLQVFMRTDETDSTPHAIWYFWVPINSTTNKPRNNGGQLDVRDAGFVQTGPHRWRSQPAAVVWPDDSGKNWAFLFAQSENSHLYVWKKVIDDPKSIWQLARFGNGPVDFNYFDQWRGGLTACLVPKWFGSSQQKP